MASGPLEPRYSKAPTKPGARNGSVDNHGTCGQPPTARRRLSVPAATLDSGGRRPPAHAGLWTTRRTAPVVVGAWHYAGIRGPEARRVPDRRPGGFRTGGQAGSGPETTPALRPQSRSCLGRRPRGARARGRLDFRPEVTPALGPEATPVQDQEPHRRSSSSPCWLEAWRPCRCGDRSPWPTSTPRVLRGQWAESSPVSHRRSRRWSRGRTAGLGSGRLGFVMGSAVSFPLFGGLRLLRGLLPPCPAGTFGPPVG